VLAIARYIEPYAVSSDGQANLQRPRIMPGIGEGVTAGIPQQHEAVNREGEAGALIDALYLLIDGVRRERALLTVFMSERKLRNLRTHVLVI